MSNIRNNVGFWGKAIMLPSLIFVLSLSVLAPQKTHAQSIGSAAASGVASGLASCATQIGGTIAGSAVGSFAATKLANVADITAVPTGDAGTQSANLTNNIVRTAREGCLDAIAYNIAKEVLNQLSDATLKWVESRFTEFGQKGNEAFVGNVDDFLSNVGQQTFNRFMNEVTAADSPLRDVCSTFSRDILEQVGQDYFQENQAPAGMAWSSGLLPSTSTLRDATTNCSFGNLEEGSMQAFLDGNFQEGGWKAYRSMVQNPKSNPVGAYMESKDDLKQRIQQAKNTNLTELSNNGGWISEVACPDGSLSTTTNSCTNENGKTISEPAIRTPGNVVNEVINSTVTSDQRRLELANEVNEIVGALADQLVSQVIGGGTGGGSGGSSDSTKGLFSTAAQEKSDALGNFSEAAEGDYGNQLKEEYVRKTLDEQITLEQDLLSIVEDLPDTNDVARVRARVNQCLDLRRFDEERAETVEQKLNEMTSAYTGAFPAAESTGEKEVGPQKINWVGNDIDDWNYGETHGLESCEQHSDAYNISYIPSEQTELWEPYICIPSNAREFNESDSEFEGYFTELPPQIETALHVGSSSNAVRPLYRKSRNNQVKIDWKGDDFEWEHYDPFAKEFVMNIPEFIESCDGDGWFNADGDCHDDTVVWQDGVLSTSTANSEISDFLSGQCPTESTIADNTYTTEYESELNISDPGVLINDIDPQGEGLDVSVASDPSNGTLDLDTDGSFSYTPDSGFSGKDTFTYEATNNEDSCETVEAEVTINVSGQNSPAASCRADRSSGSAPLEVTFDGSQSISPGGDIVNYAWNFDNGETASSSNLVTATNEYDVPSFSNAVTFEPSLEVEDENGNTNSIDCPKIRVSTLLDTSNQNFGQRAKSISKNTFYDELIIPLPGPGTQQTEAEKYDQVPKEVGDTNRYGAAVCDERNIGERSFIVKPHDDKWTIQECSRRLIINLYSFLDRRGYRFADIPLSEYPDGERPPAFREAQGAVDNKGQFISEIENLLGSTSTTPIDGNFISPEFQSDNLREIQYDLNNVATSGTPQQAISERQQAINDRFGRIEKRFHTEDDLSAASDALSVINPDSPASVFNELKDIANSNACPLPVGWEPPVGPTPTPPTSTPPTSTPPTQERPEITDFTVARSGSNNRFITISWSATANECTAKNDSNFAQWSGPVSLSGSRIIRYESAVNLSLTCTKNGYEDSASQPIPPAQPSPFEDIRNPRLE